MANAPTSAIDVAGMAPAGAHAAIIARYDVDESDSQADYFGSRTTRAVLIMGRGNYLKSGTRHGTGWSVSSCDVRWLPERLEIAPALVEAAQEAR